MKLLFTAFIFSLSMNVFANDIFRINCKSSDIPGFHKFDASGVVIIDDYNKVEGVFSIQTQKAEAEGSIQVFEEVRVRGSRQHFLAGETSSDPYDQFSLVPANSYIKFLNLLVDQKSESSSQVFSVDNFLFRSNCYRDVE
jgi:hypothetical protein